jgi:hypothetical protein
MGRITATATSQRCWIAKPTKWLSNRDVTCASASECQREVPTSRGPFTGYLHHSNGGWPSLGSTFISGISAAFE